MSTRVIAIFHGLGRSPFPSPADRDPAVHDKPFSKVTHLATQMPIKLNLFQREPSDIKALHEVEEKFAASLMFVLKLNQAGHRLYVPLRTALDENLSNLRSILAGLSARPNFLEGKSEDYLLLFNQLRGFTVDDVLSPVHTINLLPRHIARFERDPENPKLLGKIHEELGIAISLARSMDIETNERHAAARGVLVASLDHLRSVFGAQDAQPEFFEGKTDGYLQLFNQVRRLVMDDSLSLLPPTPPSSAPAPPS